MPLIMLSRTNKIPSKAILALLYAGYLLTSASAQAATIALGSYVNERYAADEARVASDRLSVATRLVEVTVNGTQYLRLLGPPDLSEFEARDLLERARTNGYASAWFMPEDQTGTQSNQETVRSVNAAAVAAPVAAPVTPTVATPADTNTTEASPSQTISTAATTEPPSTATSTIPDTVPGTAPTRLLLTANTIEEGASIEVPQFVEGQFGFELDGELNEPIWSQVPGYDQMRVLQPDTLEVPRHKTVVRYFYTEHALYVSMFAEQPQDTLLERLSSRDDYFLRDGMSITLDTSGSGIYGYWFSVSLGDSLADGKVAPERQYSRQWDGPWNARTASNEDGWTAEMVLPWGMMAMPAADGARNIGLYVSRLVGYLDENYGYPALPPTGARFMSALQPMDFEEVKPKRQLDFYPYVSATHDAAGKESEGKAGVDMFWRPSTNLQMSATLNPDFGAVESDDVVVNLTSTETFFPEKRLFFLEGTEIFATTPRSVPRISGSRTTGSRRTTQLFIPEPTQVVNTRRIGGGADVNVPPGVIIPGYELSRPTDLLGAAKGTGQVGRIRYGLMAAFEDDGQYNGLDEDGQEVVVDAEGRDYGVVRLLYQNTGASRKSIGYIGTYVQNPNNDAVVHGADAHYLSRSGKLQLDGQLLASDVSNDLESQKGYGAMLDANYTQRRGLVHSLRLDAQDDKLDINDLGFLRRNDNYGGMYAVSLTKSQGLKTLRNFNTSLSASYWENGDGLATRVGTFWRSTFAFKNFFELRTELDYFPARWDDLESEGNGAYRTDDRWIADVAFGTNASKVLSFSGRAGVRQEELSGWSYRTALGFTYKPNYRFSLDLDLNYQDRDGWLLHTVGNQFTTYDAQDFQPRLGMDLFFTARQQFRMSLQWAAIKSKEQERWLLPEDGDGYLVPVIPDPDASARDFTINRMTVQLRYRWQIAPLSDFFIVYTRGSNYPSDIDDGFGDMFIDAIGEPVIDFLVLKLRYRFGM